MSCPHRARRAPILFPSELPRRRERPLDQMIVRVQRAWGSAITLPIVTLGTPDDEPDGLPVPYVLLNSSLRPVTDLGAPYEVERTPDDGAPGRAKSIVVYMPWRCGWVHEDGLRFVRLAGWAVSETGRSCTFRGRGWPMTSTLARARTPNCRGRHPWRTGSERMPREPCALHAGSELSGVRKPSGSSALASTHGCGPSIAAAVRRRSDDSPVSRACLGE